MSVTFLKLARQEALCGQFTNWLADTLHLRLITPLRKGPNAVGVTPYSCVKLMPAKCPCIHLGYNGFCIPVSITIVYCIQPSLHNVIILVTFALLNFHFRQSSQLGKAVAGWLYGFLWSMRGIRKDAGRLAQIDRSRWHSPSNSRRGINQIKQIDFGYVKTWFFGTGYMARGQRQTGTLLPVHIGLFILF